MSDHSNCSAVCPVCPHRCRIAEGKTGRCRARGTRDGSVVPLNYGFVTSLALDPIERNLWPVFIPAAEFCRSEATDAA